MSPVPEAPSSSVSHFSLAMRRATARFQKRWMPKLNTSHNTSYREAIRPNTSSCCHANSVAFSLDAASESTRDDFLHDLVRAAVDALHARIREQSAHQIFVHVAVAAMQLHAFVEHLLL